jgi:hypothetical protein
MIPSRDWTFETDPMKTAFMLLANHATQEREAAMAAMISLIRTDEIDRAAYALGAAFAELSQPGRDRDRPYVNLDLAASPLRNDFTVTANSLIAAAANKDRDAALTLLQVLRIEEKIQVVSLLLDLVLYGIRRLPPPLAGRHPAAPLTLPVQPWAAETERHRRPPGAPAVFFKSRAACGPTSLSAAPGERAGGRRGGIPAS